MIRSLSLLSVGVVAMAVAGAVKADNDLMRLDGKGDAEVQQTRYYGGGFRGGFGGYRGFGYGGYRGVGFGGYRGFGYGGYRGFGGYRGYGYGGYYRPYYGFGYGLGLGLGLGYGGYGGYYGGYGGSYGVGYGSSYYGVPYYSSYSLGPCATTTAVIPATTLNLVGPSVPQMSTDGTFPYDGGPQNGYVAPGLNPAGIPNRSSQPRDGYLVSVPSPSSGYHFLAFGEQSSTPAQPSAPASDTLRVSYPVNAESTVFESTSGFSGGSTIYPAFAR